MSLLGASQLRRFSHTQIKEINTRDGCDNREHRTSSHHANKLYHKAENDQHDIHINRRHRPVVILVNSILIVICRRDDLIRVICRQETCHEKGDYGQKSQWDDHINGLEVKFHGIVTIFFGGTSPLQ